MYSLALCDDHIVIFFYASSCHRFACTTRVFHKAAPQVNVPALPPMDDACLTSVCTKLVLHVIGADLTQHITGNI